MKSFLSLLICFLFSLSAFAEKLTEVKIGLASNFSEVSTGSSNPYGGYFKDGVTLALSDSEARLKAKGITVKTQDFDYGASDIKVLAATRRAIESNVLAVIGYNYSSNALLAAPLHQKAKLPMLTPSASANRLGQFGRYIHMGSIDNSFMGEILARTARNKLKARKAILLPAVNCAYCSDLAESFTHQFQKLGGTISASFPVLEDDKDFSSIADQLKNLDFDVVLVPNQELTSSRLIAAMVKAGISKPFVGADGWGNIGKEFFGILGGASFSGYSTSHWHPDLKDEKSRKFVDAYRKRFSKLPNDSSVLAYDATLLLVDALIEAKALTSEGLEESLNAMKTFKGVTGQFLLSPNRAPEKSIVLLKTGNQKFQIVETIHPQKPGSL
ncbi:MAG: ABC transporter substrate-binding protein [Bdellovibrionia bacterium]